MNKRLHSVYIGFLILIGISIPTYLLISGFDYYSSSEAVRFWNTKHHTLKPGGFLGHGLGVIGSLMMIFGVVLYMIRKRVKKFLRFGILKHWLEFHIFLCSAGPLLVLFHTTFKFGGLVSISFWSMVAVVISGVIGRFIYIQIPRTIDGIELNNKELNDMIADLTYRLKTEYNLKPDILNKIDEITATSRYRNVSIAGGIQTILVEYFEAKSILREIRKDLLSITKKQRGKILKTAKNKITLSRRVGMLRIMHRLFKYWHVAHLPFAIVMFIIMFIHILVAVTFGYKWIF